MNCLLHHAHFNDDRIFKCLKNEFEFKPDCANCKCYISTLGEKKRRSVIPVHSGRTTPITLIFVALLCFRPITHGALQSVYVVASIRENLLASGRAQAEK